MCAVFDPRHSETSKSGKILKFVSSGVDDCEIVVSQCEPNTWNQTNISIEIQNVVAHLIPKCDTIRTFTRNVAMHSGSGTKKNAIKSSDALTSHNEIQL